MKITNYHYVSDVWKIKVIASEALKNSQIDSRTSLT